MDIVVKIPTYRLDLASSRDAGPPGSIFLNIGFEFRGIHFRHIKGIFNEIFVKKTNILSRNKVVHTQYF